MKIVVTGGAGFIGANLCRLLASSGQHEVVAFDDLSTGCRPSLAETVAHLAARPSVPRSLTDPIASHEANTTGTLRVLEAARQHGVGHVVVASSSVYGANPVVPKHKGLVPQPRSPYAASELAAALSREPLRVYGDGTQSRAGDVLHSQADQTRFRTLFPSARAVPFVDGLRATVEWFRSTQTTVQAG